MGELITFLKGCLGEEQKALEEASERVAELTMLIDKAEQLSTVASERLDSNVRTEPPIQPGASGKAGIAGAGSKIPAAIGVPNGANQSGNSPTVGDSAPRPEPNRSKCGPHGKWKGCGTVILWGTYSGKPAPYNEDGSLHRCGK